MKHIKAHNIGFMTESWDFKQINEEGDIEAPPQVKLLLKLRDEVDPKTAVNILRKVEGSRTIDNLLERYNNNVSDVINDFIDTFGSPHGFKSREQASYFYWTLKREMGE